MNYEVDYEAESNRLAIEMRDVESYAAVFGWDNFAMTRRDLIKAKYELISRRMANDDPYFPAMKPGLYSGGWICPVPCQLPEITPLVAAKMEDERKRCMRTSVENKRAFKPAEPEPEPDLYLFPESAYNLTGWANLNYGTSRY